MVRNLNPQSPADLGCTHDYAARVHNYTLTNSGIVAVGTVPEKWQLLRIPFYDWYHKHNCANLAVGCSRHRLNLVTDLGSCYVLIKWLQ